MGESGWSLTSKENLDKTETQKKQRQRHRETVTWKDIDRGRRGLKQVKRGTETWKRERGKEAIVQDVIPFVSLVA